MRTKSEINSREWFGDIPSGWNMMPIKALFRFNKGLSLTKSDLISEGSAVISYGQIHSKDNQAVETNHILYRYVPVSSVVNYPSARVLKDGFIFADTSEDLAGCGANVRMSEDNGVYGGYHTIVLNPIKEIDSKFLAYLFTTDLWRRQIRRDLVDVKLFSINQTTLAEVYVVVPPVDIQQRITAYLDKRCAVIDDDIVKRCDVIEKLKEFKMSLVAETVTKGLNPHVEMKGEETPWINECPKHWIVTRLAHCFLEVHREPDVTLPVLSVSIHSGISDKELDDEDRNRKVHLSEDRTKYQGVCKNDLVYNMMRAWQGAFGCSSVDGLVSPAYVVLSPLPGIDTKYFEYLLHTQNYQQVIDGFSRGIADFRKRLYWESARYIKVALPPISEQKDIASYLEERCAMIDEVISRQKLIIERLGEYRKSMIHNAVTGRSNAKEGECE